jgi:hypothetical protein
MNFDMTGTDYSEPYDNASDELNEILISVPDPERLNDIVLLCDPDTFLKILMGNIRKALISFQAWLQKIKQARVNHIVVNLNNL